VSSYGAAHLWSDSFMRLVLHAYQGVPTHVWDRAGCRFRAAAEHNHASAQYGLGYMHLVGHGVAMNHRKAYKYFSSAAEQVWRLPKGHHLCMHRDAFDRNDTVP
jgi:Sel1 repeat